jgi:hypothetical protein
MIVADSLATAFMRISTAGPSMSNFPSARIQDEAMTESDDLYADAVPSHGELPIHLLPFGLR